MSSVGDRFRILAATIHWLGRERGPEAAARQILTASQAPRMHSRPLDEVCLELAGPVPWVLDAEAWRLAEQVMAAQAPLAPRVPD